MKKKTEYTPCMQCDEMAHGMCHVVATASKAGVALMPYPNIFIRSSHMTDGFNVCYICIYSLSYYAEDKNLSPSFCVIMAIRLTWHRRFIIVVQHLNQYPQALPSSPQCCYPLVTSGVCALNDAQSLFLCPSHQGQSSKVPAK